MVMKDEADDTVL